MDTRKLKIDHSNAPAHTIKDATNFDDATGSRLQPEDRDELVNRWNAYPDLVAALESIELRLSQARIASNIGQPRLKDADFLRGECERIAKDARTAIANATKGQ